MVVHECNFCDGILTPIFTTQEISVGICSDCGLIQQFNFDHISDELYTTNENLPDFVIERKRQIPWNTDRIELLQQFFKNFIINLSVLDYGCGTGAFLDFAKDKFKKLIGFDVSKDACDINNKDNLKSLNNIDDVTNDYDVITLFHVLEHIKTPKQFLVELQQKFSNATYFVIEVPHTNEALVSLYKNKKYMNNHYCLDHLWYFTEKTLSNVLESASLEVVYSGQIQRYPLSNHLKWLSNDMDESKFEMFNKLSNEYTKTLIDNKIADSLFMICKRK